MRLRKLITSWTLLLVFVTHIVGVGVVYALYDFNQPKFVALFCVNKTKLSMKCNGSCMLSKLKDAGPQESSKSALKDITEINYYFFSHKLEIPVRQLERLLPTYPPVRTDNYLFAFAKAVFHPPGLI